MKHAVYYVVITAFSVILFVGCTTEQEKAPHAVGGYKEVRDSAWSFIGIQDWQHIASEDWQSAKVNKVVVDDGYELLDDTFRGKEVLAVSFEAKANSVVYPSSWSKEKPIK